MPEGATFKFIAGDPELANGGLLCREIHNTTLIGKYAFFTPPLTATPELFYLYNDTFKHYAEGAGRKEKEAPPMPRKQAQKAIDGRNRYKGGHWVLHTVAEHDALTKG